MARQDNHIAPSDANSCTYVHEDTGVIRFVQVLDLHEVLGLGDEISGAHDLDLDALRK